MKTYSLKAKDISRKWYLLDASQTPMGRLATMAASLLIGKRKPNQTPHIDNGDYVVIINSDKLKITGNKTLAKIYHRHSGYPGGLHQTRLQDVIAQDSARAVRQAVRGMLPNNKLRQPRLNRLKIYGDSQHGHAAQDPEPVRLSEKG